MDYEMEELLHIVATLAEKYTGGESSSISYEKAGQLMEAVMYCIRETNDREFSEGKSDGTEFTCVAKNSKISAKEAYESGKRIVKEKVQAALQLYHHCLQDFVSYGNSCLQDTFLRGMPEFFKRYDPVFNPQDTILTLDYPVLKDLSKYSGIDRIFEYIRCIELEQLFLRRFPEDFVIKVLRKYDPDHKKMIENISEIVYLSLAVHTLVEKPLSEEEFSCEDWEKLRDVFARYETSRIKSVLKGMTDTFVGKYCDGNRDLHHYLEPALDGMVARLKAVEGSGHLS